MKVDEIYSQKLEYNEVDKTLTSFTWQENEKDILAFNQELRKNPGQIKDLGAGTPGGAIGRMEASIPEIVYYSAIENGFQINHPDQQIKRREYLRFFATPIGKACLVK